jgi:hypothetical protein
MLDIHIKTIPHKEQRYPTLGDYWRNSEGKQEMRISEMGNDDYAFIIAIHEMIEWYLTEKRGIKEEDIKAFDEMFEKEFSQGLHPEAFQPGLDPRAPYIKEHAFAVSIEKQLAKELGIKWEKYNGDLPIIYEKLEESEDKKMGKIQ